ncbi:MAG: hypothetical protein K0Q65_61 [Clostridia bacterium]|jgi:hypothetical protein|nr:hypothetical protein [Clostridia bacterium]
MSEMEYNEVENDICQKPKGGNSMPRKDGTGPMGCGAMIRNEFGVCSGKNPVRRGNALGLGLGLGLGLELGYRRGLGRSFSENSIAYKTQKELLQERKGLFERELDLINKQLERL